MTDRKKILSDSIRRRLSVDTRALAVFRISLGLLVVADVVLRARHLTAFYTDNGVLPRSVLAELFPPLAAFSVHTLSGDVWFQTLLFALTGVVGLVLALGWRSRAACLLSFFLVASMYARNPYILNGGNTIFAVLLFLGVFLPLGARWSIDAKATQELGTTENTHISAASMTALIFVLTIYATNSVLRYRSDEWMSGTAVQYVFGMESRTTLLGPYIAEIPALLVAINWAWAAMLTTSFLLLLLTGWPRALFAASFVAAHVSMGLTLRLGIFPLIVVSVLFLFFPPVFWDRFESTVARLREHIRGPARSDDTKDSEKEDFLVSTARLRLTPAGVRRFVARVSSAFVLVLLIGFLFWQGAALGYVDAPGDGNVHPDEYSWKMFAPNPPDDDGWFVVPVELESGETVEGFPRPSANTQNPEDISNTYPAIYWYQYFRELRYGGEAERRAFAEYFCDRASEAHDSDARSVDLVYIEKEVVLNGAPELEDEERKVVYSHDC